MSITRILLVAVVVSGAGARPLAAQQPSASSAIDRAAPARAGLAVLAALAGEWEGEAKVVQGPGAARVVRQHEHVAFGADRTVLFIRGTGRSAEPAAKDSIVFEAAAVAWGDTNGKVRMRAYREGNEIEADVVVRPDTLEWSFPVPGGAGRVRYVIAFGSDTWHEIGTFERAGAPAFRILEMMLRRKR